jgi:tetratricopeptide (TPR) repeat protein
MRRVAPAALLLAFFVLAKNPTHAEVASAITIQDQPSTAPSPQTGGQASAETIDALRRQGMGAFQAGDYAGALPIFRQVIAADPGDIVAYNVAGNCSLRLGDYPSAIDSFQHALQLRPDEWHNLSGLMRAYTLAGMTPERDALGKHIEELAHDGKLPPNFNYVFETFQATDKKVEVAKFPQIQGFYGERYRFKVFNSAGKQVFCVTLESDSLEQPAWARQHPKEAAAGARRFSLDGYATDAHSTYSFYDGEPSYDQVRGEVLQVLAGKKQPVSKTNFPTPQPIPGADQ